MNTSTERTPSKCKYLRSKEMFYETAGSEDERFSGGAFWCSKTQECFGPDGSTAGKEECVPGRGCYLS